jgi:hypothetical protein
LCAPKRVLLGIDANIRVFFMLKIHTSSRMAALIALIRESYDTSHNIFLKKKGHNGS